MAAMTDYVPMNRKAIEFRGNNNCKSQEDSVEGVKRFRAYSPPFVDRIWGMGILS